MEDLPEEICCWKKRHESTCASCIMCAAVRDGLYWKPLKLGAKQVYLSLRGRTEDVCPEPGGLNSKEDVGNFLVKLTWVLADNASLRKSLSHMGFVYCNREEAEGAAHEQRLKDKVVQATRVVFPGSLPLEKLYVRVGKDRGNIL